MKTSLKTFQFKSALKASKVYNFNNIRFQCAWDDFGGIGFIVKKTLGSSVMRNCFKRRCRSEFRNLLKLSSQNFTLIVYPQKKLDEVNKHVFFAFNKLKKEIVGD